MPSIKTGTERKSQGEENTDRSKNARIQFNTYFGVYVSESREDEHETEWEEENKFVLREGKQRKWECNAVWSRDFLTHTNIGKTEM